MTRAELRKAFRESEEPHGPREKVKQRILGVREQLQKAGNDRFWMQMAPLKPLEVDPQSEELRELLEEPEATGNRRAGWIVVGRGLAELRKRRLVLVWPPPQWGDEGKYRQETEIRADGTITYSAPLEVLFWSPSTDPTREEETKQIWPFALLELPVSFMRLASRVYEGRLTDEDLLLADLALLSLQGVVLRPSSPSAPWRSGRIRYDYFTDRQEYPEDDFTLVEPLELTFAEVSREPDRCAFRLVRLVYEAFGFGEEAIPVEFDRRAGRLMLSQ
jgi:hypothetical protein